MTTSIRENTYTNTNLLNAATIASLTNRNVLLSVASEEAAQEVQNTLEALRHASFVQSNPNGNGYVVVLKVNSEA